MFPFYLKKSPGSFEAFLQTERYHLPLLLQSLGVKWRHLGSIRKCLFCIALSWPSTISSESVRMYCPYRNNKSNVSRWTLSSRCVFEKVLLISFDFINFNPAPMTMDHKHISHHLEGPSQREEVEKLWTVSHLVIVDEVEVLKCWNDIFLLHTCDLTDLTGG